jgi:peptidoglycan/xylan/chitin deacetylase (PgdA/CDA1 family)
MRLRLAPPVRAIALLIGLALVTMSAGCAPTTRSVGVAPVRSGPPTSATAPTGPATETATSPATAGTTAPTPTTSATGRAGGLPPGGPVALTFDDGPDPTWTPQILAVLKENHIKATFFEIGKEVRANPRIARMVLAAGMVIGDHTESHLDLRKASAAVVTAQIKDGAADIQRITGEHVTYFRFPYGAITPRVRTIATGLGLKVVSWDLDTEDWKKPEANWIVRHVIDLVHPGEIILMHDGGGDRSRTVAALKAIIARLKAHSYRFVTLEQLQK